MNGGAYRVWAEGTGVEGGPAAGMRVATTMTGVTGDSPRAPRRWVPPVLQSRLPGEREPVPGEIERDRRRLGVAPVEVCAAFAELGGVGGGLEAAADQ